MGVSLLNAVSGGLIEEKLVKLLVRKLQGELDGKPLEVSPASSGRKLVVKGWRRDNKRIAVRYSANWDNLDGGVATYQAAGDDSFKPTTGTKVVAKASGLKVTAKLTFTDRAGIKHTAKFWSEIG